MGTAPDKGAAIAAAWRKLLEELGYDVADPHLADTPARVSRFFLEWHAHKKEPPKLTVFPNEGYDEIVAVGGIRFHSMCAHHGLPFFGTAAVGYLPGASIVGLSKLARVVDHFSRRFQTQENITRQVADYLMTGLSPRGVGVVMKAEHLCMSMRGIERPGHVTVTSDLRGVFRESQSARSELLTLVDG